MQWYMKFGYKEFIICLGYKGTEIINYFKEYHLRNSTVIIDSKGKIEGKIIKKDDKNGIKLHEPFSGVSPRLKKVKGIKVKNVKTNKIEEIKVDGLFVAIGHDPATSLFKDQLKMDNEGYLITKPDSTETNVPGVYAAGDVKDKTFRQAVTAAGMGCMAALEAEKHLSHK